MNQIPKFPLFKASQAFTLVELLVVIAIMAILGGFGVMSMHGLQGSNGFTTAGEEIVSLSQLARNHALANNTYVFLGLVEVDAREADDQNPVVGVSESMGGRIYAAIVASNDGSLGYEMNRPEPLKSEFLVPLGKIRKFEGVHLVDLSPLPIPAEGEMARRKVINPKFHLGNDASVSATPFSLPTGESHNLMTFDRVIQFDPRGAASLVLSDKESYVDCFELGLQKQRGSGVPKSLEESNLKEIMAIQIDGITGNIQSYRP